MGWRHLHIFVPVICYNKVPYYSMYSLYDCVNLWVPGESWLSLNTILIFYKGFLTRDRGIILLGHT